MAKTYPHIFLRETQETKEFISPRSGAPKKKPQRNRRSHSTKLKSQWFSILEKIRRHEEPRPSVSMRSIDGVYVEFEGAPGYELVTKSLENRQEGIRLHNVYTVRSDNEPTLEITRATVFIPTSKQHYFLEKINEYAHQETKKGNPKHASLVESVEDIRLAKLESFWRDDLSLLPNNDTAVWCEIWLQGTTDDIKKEFLETVNLLSIETQPRSLNFPERMVWLCKTSREQLINLIESNCNIAEFRRAKETARFFLELNNSDQIEWVNELQSRLRVNPNATVAVCVLDTGANNGHLLLQPVLADSDCHAVDPRWGVNDHEGHGTLMCGVAAFGDLTDVLQDCTEIRVDHCLESSKILPPPPQENHPELYGDITIQGIYRAEIQAPDRNRICCMAVTAQDNRDHGRPSSWSAAIDKLTSGYENDSKRLFIVSAGNNPNNKDIYSKNNFEYSIHDPGQSWNALTVGAYTQKANLTDPDLQDYTPLAQPDELSPFSSTSLIWEKKWPIKPDIIMEGGNLVKAPDNFISKHDDLVLLSTGSRPTQTQFGGIEATSAAAAQGARMAAQILTRYPSLWPETIRGLMIHSAEWKIAMKRQFLTANSRGEYSKSDYGRLLRICGYGVPNLVKALNCASNTLTLISEAKIQPYTKKMGRSNCSTKDMHLYRLPWPSEVLLALGETTVILRVTLSYFIEPAPGEVGWRDKYRYASYGLRFDLNSSNENEEQFLQRLNAAAREDGERPESQSGSERWLIGANSRNKGSVHSDIWEGSAADIASCNLIGVYPVIGWWRERTWLGRWDKIARYSLIVSLHTQDENIDIYTPVAIKLSIPVEVT